MSCCVEQVIRHDALAVVLPLVVAAPFDAGAGTTHSAWQVAAVVLHANMQVVVVELCAKRSH